MCKKILIAAIASFCLVFTGCSQQTKQEENQLSVKDTGMKEEIDTKADNTSKEKAGVKNELQILCRERMHFMSEAGYYYITEKETELKDGTYGRHIMYMDFAAKQEVYLCAEPGCKHNKKNCTAVLASEEFGEESFIFVCNDTLYVISQDDDKEGSVLSSPIIIGDEGGDFEFFPEETEIPVVLYSMGLDGTNRRKEYTFEQGIMLDEILYDGKDIYFTIKKVISSNKSSTQKKTTYYTVSDYELVKYQKEDSKLAKVCSLEFGDNVRWYIKGCHNNNIILRGRKYNGNLTSEERIDLKKEEAWKYENDSKDMYVKLDLKQGTIKEIYSVENDPNSCNCVEMLGDYLYVSQEKTGIIEKIDMKTGKVQKLTNLKQNRIYRTLFDKLCCSSWDLQKDHTIYFVDVNSGKVEHCTLVNHRTRGELEIIGEVGNKLLAIYDWDAEKDETVKDEDAYEVKRKQYGLIHKTNLYQSKDRFEKIEMKGAGE